MVTKYKTISATTEGLYKEKGSKFISFSYPVNSEEQAKEIIKLFQSKYHDAKHVCYAYRLNPDGRKYKLNDAGEPTNTAGKPIYGQILSKEITNVMVVVVRYFGGTKLGVGGLISAYKGAAASALGKAKVVERSIVDRYEIKFAYNKLKEVQRIMKLEKIEPRAQSFEIDCLYEIDIPSSEVESITERLKLIDGIKLTFLATV